MIKTNKIIVALGLAGFLFSCTEEKVEPEIIEVEQRESAAQETPLEKTVSLIAVDEESSNATIFGAPDSDDPIEPSVEIVEQKQEFLPDGKYTVIKSFSATTEHGIHGFPVGKEVTLISESEDFLRITDGIMETEISRDHLTNEVQASELASETQKKALIATQEARKASYSHMQTSIDKNNDLEIQRQKSVIMTNISRTESLLSRLQNQLKSAEDAMRSLKKKHGTIGGDGIWRPEKSWFGSHERMRLEQEIPKLKADVERVKSSLGQLNADLSRFN